MPSRFSPLAPATVLIATLALSLGACAPASAPVATAPAPPAITERQYAMADSLMALPPAQLTDADIRWLEMHENRVARAEQAEQQRQAGETARQASGALGTYLIISALVSVGTVIWLFTL